MASFAHPYSGNLTPNNITIDSSGITATSAPFQIMGITGTATSSANPVFTINTDGTIQDKIRITIGTKGEIDLGGKVKCGICNKSMSGIKVKLSGVEAEVCMICILTGLTEFIMKAKSGKFKEKSRVKSFEVNLRD